MLRLLLYQQAFRHKVRSKQGSWPVHAIHEQVRWELKDRGSRKENRYGRRTVLPGTRGIRAIGEVNGDRLPPESFVAR